jgi:site-specific recombinase XerD
MSNVTFSFFPNLSKKGSKNLKTPIYLRVLFNRKKAECRLNLELTETELKNWNPIFMRVELPNCMANDYLNNVDFAFRKFIMVNSLDLHNLSAQQIRDTVLSREDNSTRQTVILYFEQYYERSVANRAGFSLGTKKNYKKAITHFANYLKKEKLTSLTFKDFEHKHAEGFKSYLLGDKVLPGKPNLKRRGMTEPSALGNIKKFRTIFDQAIEEGLIVKNPFKKLKLSNRSPRKPRCTIEQIRALVMINDNLTQHEELCRDLFIFSSFTGLAFLDTVKLPKLLLQHRNNGEIKLSRPRTKTGEQVEQFLTSFAKEMIDKYSNHPLVKDSPFTFPYVDNSDYNKTLKYLAVRAGIGFKLTTHIARHTFRQLLPEAGVQDASVISRMMGKVGMDKIDNVYYEITESRLQEAKDRFELYLLKNLGHDTK